jgi:RsiW-degrading membrane proteinase PrsW (M82 family)
MGFLLSLFFGLVPMLVFAWFVYWLDRYEKEPKVLLGGVFIWGAVVAAGGAFLINTILGLGIYMFTGSETATDLTTGSLIAPIVEESLKGFAVLMVSFIFRREFDSILDGIIYAAIVALGFAATENIYYIYQYGYAENGYQGLLWLVFVRVILVGWQHPFYTAFTGIGLAIARLSRNTLVKITAPFLGWSAAVFTHSIHNTLASLLSGTGGLLVGTIVDWSGWFFMLLVIVWAVFSEKRSITRQLSEEVRLGLITSEQYRIACSAWAQNIARLNALTSGGYAKTNRFYQACAELAHKKQQREKLGEEGGNTIIIERLRAELASLAQQI